MPPVFLLALHVQYSTKYQLILTANRRNELFQNTIQEKKYPYRDELSKHLSRNASGLRHDVAHQAQYIIFLVYAVGCSCMQRRKSPFANQKTQCGHLDRDLSRRYASLSTGHVQAV